MGRKKIIVLICVVLIFFLLTGYKNGMVVNKYLSEVRIENLFKNYHLFSTNFSAFLNSTTSLHQGDTEGGWKSFYYLLPLFLFFKILGGLNLQNLYFFNFAVSIAVLILFYLICEKHLGRQTANISVFFLAFSSWFFEFAMSISYHTSTILIALILIYLMLECVNKPGPANYFFLGLTAGISLYYYGPIRFLLPVVAILLFGRKDNFYRGFISFLLGLAPLLILYLLGDNSHIDFFDEENIFFSDIGCNEPLLSRWFRNLVFCLRELSGKAIFPFHTSLINRYLIVPLIAGVIQTARKSKVKLYRLLLMIAIAIILFPVFTTYAHSQPRRYTLYIIPVYMLIGIGCAWIIKTISSIRRKKLRIFSGIFVVFLSFYIVVFELTYVRRFIWSGKRASGLMHLGRRISESSIESPVFYLQEIPHSLFEVECESYLLMLAVRNAKPHYKVAQISKLDDLQIYDKAYIIKSPFISRNNFKNMVDKQNLSYKELFSVPAASDFEYMNNAFRVYVLSKK